MHLISVNIGKRQAITRDGPPRFTGIFKRPVSAPLAVTRDGLAGDVIVEGRHHGGADQAIYAYGEPDYAWWSRELGREVLPGTFGENLTIAGLESATCRVGDRLHLGGVVLEVTAPRIPCGTFAARMEDPRFPQRFRAAERPGVYCRVLREGTVEPGEAVRYEPTAGPTVAVIEMFRDFYEPERTVAAINRFLAAPIAARDRAQKEKQLRDLNGSAPERGKAN